jgi:hypothetical protein
MRELIPLDIYKSNHKRLLDQGLPRSIADRVWNNKILWLIVMHPEDIAKVIFIYFFLDNSLYFLDPFS